jgi:chromosome segregation ATPase
VNAAPNPVDPSQPSGEPSVSAAADRARAQLHEEIERVRNGVEEMLAEQQDAPGGDELRRELDALREDTRLYVKKRIRRSEKKLGRSVGEIDARTRQLEKRLDQLDAERRLAEYRIHSETERMLDTLLQEVRGIADRLEGRR